MAQGHLTAARNLAGNLKLCIRLLGWCFIFTASTAFGAEAEVGVDDWLILSNNLRDFMHQDAYSAQSLAAITRKISSMSQNLSRHGTTFLWTVVPNTPSVYPESIPRRIKPVAPQSRLMQLSGAMKYDQYPNFLDLTPALLDAKKQARLYQKTDTHWNDYGAYIGYQSIMRRLALLRPDTAAKLSPWPMQDFSIEVKPGPGGDLAKMLALQDEMTEDKTSLVPKRQRKTTEVWSDYINPDMPEMGAVNNPERRTIRARNPAMCPGPSLIMYRDSFADKLLPFLLEHFCKAIVIWYQESPINLKMIERERPTFVILENSERFLELMDDSLETTGSH